MPKFVLGSSSKTRLNLLKQINFYPDIIEGADINEKPFKREKPIDYVKRMADTKAKTLYSKYFGNVILCADTIISNEAKIIQKPKDNEELKEMLRYYSSRNIKVITSICLITSDHKFVKKTVSTSLKFKHLNEFDIKEYIKSGYGLGKAGGIAIETMMDAFVIKIVGSYSNIQGLPLYETRNLLISAGVESK